MSARPLDMSDALAAALAAEAGVTVIRGGLSFSNESNFGLLSLQAHAWAHAPAGAAWGDAAWWRGLWLGKVGATMPRQSVIRIAILPPAQEQDPTWREVIRGGVIHEVLHSRYTQRGEPDAEAVARLWGPPERQAWAARNLPRRAAWLKHAWNALEDVFIERKGVARWLGAGRPLSAVQRWVLDLEEESWAGKLVGTSRRDRILLMHRDHGKARVHDAPDLADPVRLAERYGADLVSEWEQAPWGAALAERVLRAEDSYQVLDLALELALLLEEPPPPEEPPEEPPPEEPPPPPREGAPPQEEADKPGAPEPDEPATSPTPDQEPSQPPQPSDQKPDTGGSPREYDDEDEDDAGNPPLFHSPFDAIQQEAAEAMREQASRTRSPEDKKRWPHPCRRDQWPEPWAPEAPLITRSEPLSPEDLDARLPALREAEVASRKLLGASRDRLVALLRGQEKSLPQHRQKAGRRLSPRSAHEVVTREPEAARPWMTAQKHPRRSTAVCLLLDMSGSMNKWVRELTEMTLSLSEVFQTLSLAHEVVGYTSKYDPKLTAAKRAQAEARLWDHTDLIHFHVLKGWDQRATPALRATWLQWPELGGTPLADALTWAWRSLTPRKEDQRLMILFTDGEPAYGGTPINPVQWVDLLRLQIQALRSSGLEVMLIVLHSPPQDSARAPFARPSLADLLHGSVEARNLLVLEELSELPRALTSWMTSNLKIK